MKAGILLLLAAAEFSALAACSKTSGTPPPATSPQAPAKAPAPVKPGPTAAEQTAGMVDAASPAKSSVPVDLKFDFSQRPKVGQALDIRLALVSHVDATAATIRVTGVDGLTLSSDANQFEVPSVAADQVYRQTVTVTPNAEGVLILGLSVSLKHDEIVDSKAFSIPIIADR